VRSTAPSIIADHLLIPWADLLTDRPEEFSSLFHRILSMSLEDTTPWAIRTQILLFVIDACQSLEHPLVRKEIAPLVGISIWHNLAGTQKRDALLDEHPHLKRAWKASTKRFAAADEATKARLRIERSWLYTLVLGFLSQLHSSPVKQDVVVYCERFLELLTGLLGQLPTRRYVNLLLQDLHITAAMKLSPAYGLRDNQLLRDMGELLSHFIYFSVDDQTGAQLSRTEAYDKHCADLAKLQRIALKEFPDKLTVLALSNYASIDKRDELSALLEPLTDEELLRLVSSLQLRSTYPEESSLIVDRSFLLEILLSTFERRDTFQETAQLLSTVPTEATLFNGNFSRAELYDGSRPLPIPKLNLQYLSIGDFLWRSFILYRSESFYGIRRDIEDTIRRLKPDTAKSGDTIFAGKSRMALSIAPPSILEVVPALVGDDTPSAVRAEIVIDIHRLADNVRRDWTSLRPDDVVFLLHVDASARNAVENGDAGPNEARRLGLITVRTAEISQILDHGGKPIRDASAYFDGRDRSSTRRLQLKLDAVSYKEDMARAAAGKRNVYEGINMLVRRSGRENNFKPILESIRGLILAEAPLPTWLHEVFLGYGDPAAASYKHMDERIRKIDYLDTFLDWQHLIESLPGKIIEPSDDMSGSFPPPYVLESVEQPEQEAAPPPSKKRRRDEESAPAIKPETLRVSTYKPPNNGPYPVDAQRLNTVRFTPAQVEAITSGTQPGLSVIVGPPGTGKTDVATQIINNLYHNFPGEKTLLIAHSNQALNQLFAKIAALDIDQRHLLRLGRGEEELGLEGDFSKHGRVESFLDNRDQYLAEVNRLAASIGAPGAHGNSAETAGYFNKVYIEPAWARYSKIMALEEISPDEILQAFPFHDFFSNAPQPVFPPGADREQVVEIANGCYRHISRMFSELADVLPFEILRRERDKANYLLTNEARIIAMTSTHAAMRRGEIASLGFHYDNVVMEEAAQVTEIESFIPLALQKSENGQSALMRLVLCGDHYQNSPIIQSLAFRNYAGLEQSLFARFVRLGIPVIQLDQQGRARASLARLYHWRYPYLSNLPHVLSDPTYLAANAGFKYDYQFINVPDYQGAGEKEPVPHFLQNLGEAEYAVAIYQYMRLLGYPASRISILTTYAGQRALVKDILAYRCAKSPLFGLPRMVTTVDKYQGEQNDCKFALPTHLCQVTQVAIWAGLVLGLIYAFNICNWLTSNLIDIILSLTRTAKVGYLRDLRRLTVALSRARLGLYVLGRRQVFEECFELRDAFELLFKRPDKLTLVTGEMWPTKRELTADGAEKEVTGEVVMEGVEHLGQYVHEMTQTRASHLRLEMGLPAEEASDLKTIAEEPFQEDVRPNPEGDEDAKDVDGEEGFGTEEV
jgi:intron-binding protein aquarius